MSDRTAAIRDLTEAIEHAEHTRASLELAIDSLWGIDYQTAQGLTDRVASLDEAIAVMRRTLGGLKYAH